jgi:hypothetical protein
MRRRVSSVSGMTTPLADLLALVPTLNDPSQPFDYEVSGTTIIGSWNIVSAKSLYPTEFASIDKKFELRVELNEKKGTWKPVEITDQSVSAASSDTVGFSRSASVFSGKSTNKGFSFEFGGVNKKDGEDATIAPLVYSWDTAKIKKPLFDLLEANGWKRKKGLFG